MQEKKYPVEDECTGGACRRVFQGYDKFGFPIYLEKTVDVFASGEAPEQGAFHYCPHFEGWYVLKNSKFLGEKILTFPPENDESK